jgi:hypothetical protein
MQRRLREELGVNPRAICRIGTELSREIGKRMFTNL